MMHKIDRLLLVLVIGAQALLLGAADDGLVQKVSEDFGIEIMGTIVQGGAGNVVLVKTTETGRVSAFRVGHEVKAGYKISNIDRDFIDVTSTDASARVLRLTKGRFAQAQEIKSGVPAPVLAKPFGDTFREDGFERNKDKISLTEGYRDNLLKPDELSKILMQASAEPVEQGGVIVGFRLDQLEPGSIYAKAGMVNGDIISNINGVPLNSVPATIKLLHSLKKETEIGVDLLRGGQTTHVTIQVQPTK